jgi:hypothetical protein
MKQTLEESNKNLEELINKTNINFPRKIFLRDVEHLFLRIAEDLHGNIRYSLLENKNIGYFAGNQIFQRESTDIQITGAIITKETVDLNVFRLKTVENVSSLFTGIEFQLTPEWKLENYRPEVVQLWDKVKNSVEKFFAYK